VTHPERSGVHQGAGFAGSRLRYRRFLFPGGQVDRARSRSISGTIAAA